MFLQAVDQKKANLKIDRGRPKGSKKNAKITQVTSEATKRCVD
jgi:hypothetical protein